MSSFGGAFIISCRALLLLYWWWEWGGVLDVDLLEDLAVDQVLWPLIAKVLV